MRHFLTTYSTIVGKFTEYDIALPRLPKGVSTFEYQLTKEFFKNMENPDIMDADLHVVLTIDNKNDIFAMEFVITGTYTLQCTRCLDDIVLPVDTSYKINVKYGDDYNDDSDTLLEIPRSDTKLNVAYMIYDTVVLTIPMRHVHPAGKCNRDMSKKLKEHRANLSDEDAELANSLMSEVDDMDSTGYNDDSSNNTDPRWNALRGLGSEQD